MPGFPNGTTPSAPAHPTRTETGTYSCAGPYTNACLSWLECAQAFQPLECRVPALTPDDRLYARFEGLGVENACRADADCVRGGCFGEVCSADPGVITPCDAIPLPIGACGCVAGTCIWWEMCGVAVVPL